MPETCARMSGSALSRHLANAQGAHDRGTIGRPTAYKFDVRGTFAELFQLLRRLKAFSRDSA